MGFFCILMNSIWYWFSRIIYMKRTLSSIVFLILFSVSVVIHADPVKVKITPVFENLKLTKPLLLTHAGDGSDRIFVIEQPGRVLWWENKPEVKEYSVALDLRAKVGSKGWEEGLIGIAFHPKFKDNGQVFLHYTAAAGKKNVLSRFTFDSERKTIDPKSEQVILTLDQPFDNHNGGMIAFGPDGFLYISFGDGGQRDDPLDSAQNKNVWLGKILRIDVDVPFAAEKPYGIPKDNPFVGVANTKPEIYAYGLRNVWRFSFDRKTGDLWAGEVGQDLWEMILLIKKGGNYGWPVMEGSHKFTKQNGVSPKLAAGETVTGPIVEHNHAAAKSITGGYVYRGKAIPELEGAYVYGDFQTGLMWYFRFDGKEATKPQFIGMTPEIASFGEDRDGEIYVCNLKGKLFKLTK